MVDTFLVFLGAPNFLLSSRRLQSNCRYIICRCSRRPTLLPARVVRKQSRPTASPSIVLCLHVHVLLTNIRDLPRQKVSCCFHNIHINVGHHNSHVQPPKQIDRHGECFCTTLMYKYLRKPSKSSSVTFELLRTANNSRFTPL